MTSFLFAVQNEVAYDMREINEQGSFSSETLSWHRGLGLMYRTYRIYQ